MKSTTIITIVLLLFVCGSVYYLFAKESGAKQATGETKPASPQEAIKIADVVKAPANANEAQTEPKPTLQSSRVVAYYFHGNKRCANCIKIENWTHEAIDASFPVALKDGKLEWKVINTDEPANEHFIKDFKLTNKSVVLVNLDNGKQTNWKNLTGVWSYLNNQDEFASYIRTEVRAFLSGG